MTQSNSAQSKLIWIQLLFAEDNIKNSSYSLCIAQDLSSFGYFQRGSVREHLMFTSRIASSRCEKESRVTINLKELHFRLNIYKRSDGLVCVAITDTQYPSQIVQSLIINKLLRKFDEKYQVSTMDIHNDMELKFSPIEQFLADYSKPNVKTIEDEWQKDLSEVTQIMHKNIEDILCRGETLDDLLQNSDDIGEVSKTFHNKAKKTNQIANIISIDSQLTQISQMVSKLSTIVSEQAGTISSISNNLDDCCANPSTIGFSVGGSNDANSFRQCIGNNIMPQTASLTYAGLLHEYYFDTTKDNDDVYEQKIDLNDPSMLFYPSYCYAKSKFENKMEFFMTVGLNSNLRTDDFQRKKLNLVLVLDKSGSMSDCFDDERKIYYQQFNDENQNGIKIKTKMEVANEAVLCVLNHLNEDDQFGMVVFDENAECIQKLDLWKDINHSELKSQILGVQASGGTHFENGFRDAVQLYDKYLKGEYCSNEYENRIIYLTDAEITCGVTDPDTLLSMVNENAENDKRRIYTTFIGIGLDTNVNLIETISQTRGCNYHTVHSTDEFIAKMETFREMVTPLVFNVCLKLNCEGANKCCIEKVYGSGSAKEKDMQGNGEVLRIHTLFPSKKSAETGEIQGGIQLIKLKSEFDDCKETKMSVYVEVTFEDREGKCYKNEQCVQLFNCCGKEQELKGNVLESNACNDMLENDEFDDVLSEDDPNEYYDNIGIRKGIILCRYVELVKEWIEYDRKNFDCNSDTKLMVSPEYKDKFGKFCKYFQNEMKKCADDTLKKELDILNKLIGDVPIREKSSVTIAKEQVSGYFYGLYQGIKQKVGNNSFW